MKNHFWIIQHKDGAYFGGYTTGADNWVYNILDANKYLSRREARTTKFCLMMSSGNVKVKKVTFKVGT